MRARNRSPRAVAVPVSVALLLAIDILPVRADENEGFPARARPSPENLRRLEAGEIVVTTTDVPGHPLPHVSALAIVEASPDRVWEIIDACGKYKDTMPRVLESEELSREGERVRCRTKIDQPFPFSDLSLETDAVHTTRPGGPYRREWTLHRGDFNENRGSWTLEPYDEGSSTLATYEILSEPKMKIPRFLVDMALGITLPRMFDGIRERLK